MTDPAPTPTAKTDRVTGDASIRIPAETKATLDRLAKQLEADSMGDLVAFLARHFEAHSHLGRFADFRELHALADRLGTVLIFIATTNLEIGQHLRRMEAGHYRRLAQEADELVAIHNRLLARQSQPRSPDRR